mgnify:CR=1 FL=1
MDHLPASRFLLEHLDTIILHIKQRRLRIQLIRQHRHILPELHSRTAKIIMRRKQFALDRIQKSVYCLMILDTMRIDTIKIRETLF